MTTLKAFGLALSLFVATLLMQVTTTGWPGP